MKRLLLAVSLCTMMIFEAATGWALPFTSIDPIDSIVDYGTGSPSEASEKGYLADYLGLTVPELEAIYTFYKDEAIGGSNFKDLAFGWDPLFPWDFAIVKIDGPNDYWYLFMDDEASLNILLGDDLLTTPAQGTMLTSGPPAFYFNGANNGISHVTYFSTGGSEIPEPSTLLLLGTGVLGLGLLGRRKLTK